MNRVTFARWVSIIGHPFVFIVLLLGLPYWLRGKPDALRTVGVVVAIALVPLGLFMRQRHKSGRWQTVDASAPEDRPAAYLATLIVLLLLVPYFLYIEKSPTHVRGAALLAGTLTVGVLLNRWIKLSGHMAFAAVAALTLIKILPVWSLVIFLFLPLLGWSRLVLLRHTLPEVIGGLALGLLAGGIWLWS